MNPRHLIPRTEHDAASAQATMTRSLRPARIVLSIAFLVVVLTTPGNQILALDAGTSLVLAVVASANAIVNAAGMFGWIRDVARGRAFAAQMAIDALLALASMLMLDAAATPLAWIALLLPVFDAWVVFGGAAAGLTWGSLSLAYVVLTLQLKPAGESNGDVLALAVQQLAAVAIVAMPAAYVAARLRDDLAHSNAARADADHRAGELLFVAEAAKRLAAATDSFDVLDVALGCAASLGFAGVDICERHDDRAWRLLRAAGSRRGPEPMFDRRLDRAITEGAMATIGIGEGSDDLADLLALGYRAGVALPISKTPRYALALRAWSSEPLDTDSGALQSLELLTTLTAAAWQSTTTFSDLASWSKTLAHQATHDELTGLPNRAHLLQSLEDSLRRMEGTGVPCAVLFLDLDGFKEVNDELGHDAGDAVLRGIAERLRHQLRGHDLLARLGGDEFVVVLNDLDGPEQAIMVASRLCEATAAPLAIGASIVTLAASVGIAYAAPDDTVDRLLTTADRVMYEAKRGGGNRYVVSRSEAA